MSVTKTFIRVQEVTGGVVCLNLGKKGLDYRGIIKVNGLNFSLMAEEEQEAIIEGFKVFLNGLSFPIQILIRNMPHDVRPYVRYMEAVEGNMAEMAHDHAEFVDKLASRRALVNRHFYIIIPADHDTTKKRSEALLNAQTQLKLRIDELIRQLEHIGLTGHRLLDAEIIALYQSCFMPDEARQYPLSSTLLEGTNRLVSLGSPSMENGHKDAPNVNNIGSYEALLKEKAHFKRQKQKRKHARKQFSEEPSFRAFTGLADLLAPSSIQVFPRYVRIDGESTHVYTRTLSIAKYPRSAYAGWLDSIVQINEPYIDFSIHIAPLEPEAVNRRLGRKAVEFRGSVLLAQRQGRSPDPTSNIALRDVESMREKLARGDERIFAISVFVQIRGRSRRELSERNGRIVSAIRSLDFRALAAHWQHHVGLLSSLPDGENTLGRARLFGTSSASTFYPFTGADPGMEEGAMFGVLPSGGLVIINPFNSQELENANMVVFAKSGAGKSFFFKTVASRLLNRCNVYVIDPEAEYNNMCTNVRGQYVRLSSLSLQFNPLELYSMQGRQTKALNNESLAVDQGRNNYDDEGNFFREKLLNLITMCELLLSDNGSLSQKERAFLYRCLIKTYENRGITLDPRTHLRQPPDMREFYLVMSSASRGDHRFGLDEDSHGLSERLERYLHLFPRTTQIALENPFIDFNIRELNDTLKPIGLFLITEFLWTKMRQARQSLSTQPNTIILIDEAWLLMQFPQGAKFLAEFARRIRKYGGGLWCTTQNSDDFLGSEEGRTILAMSTMKFLMKQDSSTIESVTRTFRLSNGQKRFLLGARRGEGLFSTKSWTAMEVVASPKEAAMANTTLGQYVPGAVGGTTPTVVDLEKRQRLDDSEKPQALPQPPAIPAMNGSRSHSSTGEVPPG